MVIGPFWISHPKLAKNETKKDQKWPKNGQKLKKGVSYVLILGVTGVKHWEIKFHSDLCITGKMAKIDII